MYTLRQTGDPSVLEIAFDNAEAVHGLDPFHDILSEYAAETGIKPKTVSLLFNYKFTEGDSKLQFYWNGSFTIYVFYIAKAHYSTVYGRLSRICAKLNRQLNERRYFKKYGEYPNKNR